MQELSNFRNFKRQADGFYRNDRLRTYLAYDEHWAFLIRSKGEVAGFALIRKSKPGTFLIGEFFIESEFRRSGLGQTAVSQILQKFRGNWELPFQHENSQAAAFWRKIIPMLGHQVTETNLPVIDNPDLPPDTWLYFTNDSC